MFGAMSWNGTSLSWSGGLTWPLPFSEVLTAPPEPFGYIRTSKKRRVRRHSDGPQGDGADENAHIVGFPPHRRVLCHEPGYHCWPRGTSGGRRGARHRDVCRWLLLVH